MSLRRCEVPCGRGEFCWGFCWLSMVHPLSRIGVGRASRRKKESAREERGVRINGRGREGEKKTKNTTYGWVPARSNLDQRIQNQNLT